MTESTQRPWSYELSMDKENWIEDMEESRENLEGLVQRLTIQNDALVAALNDALHIVHVSSDATDLHDALKDWAHSVEVEVK